METILNRVLMNAGLGHVLDVIGQPFMFSDGEHAIAGTVTSIGYGLEEGLSIRVTSPLFRGGDISRLVAEGDKWVVLCTNDEKWPGQLEMLKG